MEFWHSLSIDDALEKLESTRDGLSREEAQRRIKKYGRNEIRGKEVSRISIFLNQFKNFLILILVFAAAVAFFLGEITEAFVIFLFIMLNTGLGFYQENKAFEAIKALKSMVVSRAEVLRDRKKFLIEAHEIVPGDIIFLNEGEKIPADCRVISCSALKADESALTGESLPAEKTEDAIPNIVPLAERSNMLFSGTTIVHGNCKCLVVETGMSTEFGNISKMLQGKEEQTPLQKNLDRMGKDLSLVLIAMCAAVFAMGIYSGMEFLEMLLVVLALAVAVLPSSLPAVVSIAMTMGARRMAGRNAIMRRLSAVETLGSTTVICTDKTGTLTVNEMTVRRILAGSSLISVTGEGFSQKGDFVSEGKKLVIEENSDAWLLLTAGMMCNNASIDGDITGDPTEIALIIASRKAGMQDLRQIYPRTHEMPFDSGKRMMATVYDIGGEKVAYVKGAFEEIIVKSTHFIKDGKVLELSAEEKERLFSINQEFSENALRVIAVATKKPEQGNELDDSGLTFIGIFGMIDPPRKEAKASIEKCKNAGIRVVMITGDHRNTAASIAMELGIIKGVDECIEASELDKMDQKELEKAVGAIRVYARATPEHKVRITEALKKQGHIVAMTGDGVNDAPALKKADIGVAMGKKGTDVAKETSDMVLADDNFSTIVSAVEEGRGIYDNIKKSTYFLLSCNFAELFIILSVTIAATLSSTELLLPLLPLQILWMNLLTDGLPAIALGIEPIEKDIMLRKPRNPKEKIISRKSLAKMLGLSMLMTAGTLWVFYDSLDSGYVYATTMAFTVLVLLEVFVAMGIKSKPVITTGISRNLLIAVASSVALQAVVVYAPQLNPVFGTVPLGIMDWAYLIAVSCFAMAALEVSKLLGFMK